MVVAIAAEPVENRMLACWALDPDSPRYR